MASTNSASERAASTPSSFVTAVAWVFIALAGFATLISVLQNLMLGVLFPVDEMHSAIREAEKGPPIPWIARFMMEHMRWFFFSFLLISTLTLVSAIGLLKRKNWARWLFIGIMAFGILWNLGSIAIPYFMFSAFPPVPEHTPADFRDEFEIMTKVMIAFTTVISVAFSILFGWIIKRLVSPEIRREFGEV